MQKFKDNCPALHIDAYGGFVQEKDFRITGTSSNHSDGWFVGVTPTLIAGAWVGGESRSIHFRTAELGEGCHTALPIYGLFMEKVLAEKRFAYLKGHFPKPTVKINKSYTCHTFIPKADTLPADSLGDAIPEDF